MRLRGEEMTIGYGEPWRTCPSALIPIGLGRPRRGSIVQGSGRWHHPCTEKTTADDATTTRDAIKMRLSELGQVLEEGVVKGCEDVGDVARTRIERWLEN